MKTIFALLLLFLGIGLFVRQYNAWTRLLLGSVLLGMIVYISVT